MKSIIVLSNKGREVQFERETNLVTMEEVLDLIVGMRGLPRLGPSLISQLKMIFMDLQES